MKLTLNKLKTLINEVLSESSANLPPETMKKLMKFLKNKDPSIIAQGIQLAIGLGMDEDEIIKITFSKIKGWYKDGINWVLLENFPTNQIFKNLTELNLWNRGLTEIPDSIVNLTNLRILYLSNNQLTSLPDSIGNLTNLIFLDLHYNQLTSLHDSIGNLTNLRKLNLSNNQLRSLQDSIGNLTNLTELDLSYNPLKSLPDSIGNLTNLERLNLDYNDQLTSLPDSIENLENTEISREFDY